MLEPQFMEKVLFLTFFKWVILKMTLHKSENNIYVLSNSQLSVM